MNAIYENYLRIKYKIPNDLNIQEVARILLEVQEYEKSHHSDTKNTPKHHDIYEKQLAYSENYSDKDGSGLSSLGYTYTKTCLTAIKIRFVADTIPPCFRNACNSSSFLASLMILLPK
jgi:hypothetical protein